MWGLLTARVWREHPTADPGAGVRRLRVRPLAPNSVSILPAMTSTKRAMVLLDTGASKEPGIPGSYGPPVMDDSRLFLLVPIFCRFSADMVPSSHDTRIRRRGDPRPRHRSSLRPRDRASDRSGSKHRARMARAQEHSKRSACRATG